MTDFYFDSQANPVPASETKVITRQETRYMGMEEIPITLVASVRINLQGEAVSDNDLDDAQDRKFIEAYRKASGKMTPDEIRALRKTLGLSQRGLANLVGWSPATVERYERGSAPSSANNKILHSLEDEAVVRKYFQNSDKSKFSKKDFNSLSKIHQGERVRADFLTAKPIADWFVAESLKDEFSDPENSDPMTQMKLHKLVYFAQVYFLGRNHQLLFEEDTEAFQYGPVYESIRSGYTFEKQREIKLSEPERKKILTGQRKIEKNDAILEVLNQVWSKLSVYTASGLMHLTHRLDSSWEKNYDGTRFKIIPNDEIAADYSVFTDLFD
ncbi:MAG: DUF4065 domain-containing protein [Streptococcaceae bacterium]|jgi:putative zinc finger/helix-turn-helix YgiT family protein|nr:DUF4065 domain-containing protein [Streptococcaceae bacterium]